MNIINKKARTMEEELQSESDRLSDNGIFPLYFSRRSSSRHSLSCELLRNIRTSRRLIHKNGKPNLHRKLLPEHVYRYTSDFVNTLISSQWKWIILALILSFMATWVAFAFLWMTISKANEDLEPRTTHKCLIGIDSFSGFLLFSIETQSTIGFGNRTLTHYCPEAVFLMCLQIMIGMGICGSLVSIVYAKMVGPHHVSSITCFSKYAVIHQRNGELCLMFRVRDSSRKYECRNTIKAYLIQRRNEELFLRSLKLEPTGILIWPIEVIHKITPSSPLWDLSAKDLIMKRFEIVIIMEGSSISTNQMSRSLSSYVSSEILWGARFESCVSYHKEKNCYLVEDEKFNNTKEAPTYLCSAYNLRKILDELVERGQAYSREKAATPLSGDTGIGSSLVGSSGTKSPSNGVSPLMSRGTSNQEKYAGDNDMNNNASEHDTNVNNNVIVTEALVHNQIPEGRRGKSEPLNIIKTSQSDELLSSLQSYICSDLVKRSNSLNNFLETDL